MSGSDLRGQLVETLRQELGELRQHQAEPLADAVMPLVQKLEAERDQLRYERCLLATARITLDLVASGQATWLEIRTAAEDVAQRIVDEIGHSVTDEPALGPSFREEIDRLRAAVERVRKLVDSGPSRQVAGHRYVRADLIEAALDQAPAEASGT